MRLALPQVVAGHAPVRKRYLDARAEVMQWVFKGAIAFRGDAYDSPPDGPARPWREASLRQK
jgi:hypothetical protein